MNSEESLRSVPVGSGFRCMHVITRKRLNEFAEKHPDTRSSLARWYAIMRKGRFVNFVQLREMFPHADHVGEFTVFNIGGNKVRLVPPCIIIETRSTSATC
jgi:mRNA interferase HigB